YVPIETILSKWYGEAEQNLSKIFEKTSLLGKAIIFIDEIDALAVARNSSETGNGLSMLTFSNSPDSVLTKQNSFRFKEG
ncbi:MAG: AAA family ATPase, partial [Flavobacteriaceae bacterium]|nr:AAA family ATPase [Flavobacteriaceae bacterium]